MAQQPNPHEPPPTWHVDPDGDLSQTGTDALIPLADHWDFRATEAKARGDVEAQRRASAARDRLIDEGMRRGNRSAAVRRVQDLANGGAVDHAAEIADRFVDEHGESVHFAIALWLADDHPRKVPLLLRAAQLGDADARFEIGRKALEAHGYSDTLDLSTALGIAGDPGDERTIDSLIDVRAAVNDAVDAVLDQVAQKEAAGDPPGKAAQWLWQRIGRDAIEFAVATGHLDDAERYAEIGLRLTTDPHRLATFANDEDRMMLDSVHTWAQVLGRKYGPEEGTRRLEQELEADNVGVLLAHAVASAGVDPDGHLDLTRSRNAIGKAMRIDPRVANNWSKCLLDGARNAADNPSVYAQLLQEAVHHAGRASEAGNHDLLISVAKVIAHLDVEVSESLTQHARAVGVEGAPDVLDELREMRTWNRFSQASPDEIREQLQASELMAAVDPYGASLEHRAAAARFLELAAATGTDLEGDAAASVGRAFGLAVQAVESGVEDDDLALAAVRRLLMEAVKPARGPLAMFDLDVPIAQLHHADLIAQKPALASGLLSGRSVERALAAAAERHAGNASRLAAVGVTASELSNTATLAAGILGYDDDAARAAHARMRTVAADQLHAALKADPSNARAAETLAYHVGDATEPPVAAFEAAAEAGCHYQHVVVRGLAQACQYAGDPERADQLFSQAGTEMTTAWVDSLKARPGGVPEPMEPARWSEPREPRSYATSTEHDLDDPLEADRSMQRARSQPDEAVQDEHWTEIGGTDQDVEPEIGDPGSAGDLDF